MRNGSICKRRPNHFKWLSEEGYEEMMAQNWHTACNWMRLSFISLTLFLVSCAAQDAHKSYSRVESKLSTLTEGHSSNDPVFREAYNSLALGRAQMLAGRYDLAIRSLRHANELAETAKVELANRKAKELAVAEALAEAERRRLEELEKLATAQPHEPAVEGAIDVSSMVVESDSSLEAGSVAAAPSVAPEAATAKKSIEKPRPGKVVAKKVKAPTPVAETPKPVGKVLVVEAPAAPTQKKPTDSKVAEVSAAAAASAAPTPVKGSPRGTVHFIVKDASIIDESVSELNQTAKFLLENPSKSLLLRGAYSPEEPQGITEQRLEAVKAYLVGKGVPEDQVQIDGDKVRGQAEVTMFEIEN